MRCLVLGATGETGRRVVNRLLVRGDEVRVLARSPAKAEQVLGTSVEVVQGDSREPQTLSGIAQGMDAAIYTIGTRTFIGKNGGQAVDAVGTENVMRALSADALPHLVFLSAFGLDRKSPFLDIFSISLNRYFHWKRLAEEQVHKSGIPYTIVRPCELRNRESRGPVLLNQEEPLSLLRTISRDLVADVLVAAAGDALAIGKTFEVVEDKGGEAVPLSKQFQEMCLDTDRTLPKKTPLF